MVGSGSSSCSEIVVTVAVVVKAAVAVAQLGCSSSSCSCSHNLLLIGPNFRSFSSCICHLFVIGDFFQKTPSQPNWNCIAKLSSSSKQLQ